VFQIDLSRFGTCDTIRYGLKETENYPSESHSPSSQSRDGKTSNYRVGSTSPIRKDQSSSLQRKRVAGIRTSDSSTGCTPVHPVRRLRRMTTRGARYTAEGLCRPCR